MENPAPLQLQCLLYTVGHLDEIPSTTLALLPRRIRYKLLLLLPVVDVCKLEETQVTADLPMNEIWQALYNNRMPVGDVTLSQYLTMPDKAKEMYNIQLTWKECYFQVVFNFKELELHKNNNTSGCYLRPYDKSFVPELLYSVFHFKDNLEAFKCFGLKSNKLHGLSRYNRLRLQGISLYHIDYCYTRSCYNCVAYPGIIKVFNDIGHVSLKLLNISEKHLIEVWEDTVFEERFLPKLNKFLSAVEVVDVRNYTSKNPQQMYKLRKILDAIFLCSTCQLKMVTMCNMTLSELAPYLTGGVSKCRLKQLQFVGQLDKASDFIDIGFILDYQVELEDAYFSVKLDTTNVASNIFIHSLLNLFDRPTLKKLNLEMDLGNNFKVLYKVLQRFFSSHYPITLQFSRIQIYMSAIISEEIQLNPIQLSKSLSFIDCILPQELAFMLPPTFQLKNLSLVIKSHFTYRRNIQYIFSQLKSVEAEMVCLDVECDPGNIDSICSLFHVVSAEEWDISVTFIDDHERVMIVMFASVLSSIKGNLIRFTTSILYDDNSILSLLEAVFLHLSKSSEPKFELCLTGCYSISDTLSTSIFDMWLKCGAVKLKKLELRENVFSDNIMSIFSDMALNVQFT